MDGIITESYIYWRVI